MKLVSFAKYLYLSRFSQPVADRILYRAVRRFRCRRIVELGIGSGHRAERLIRLALQVALGQPVRYTGVDLFEGRADACPGLTLKAAHRQLSSLPAKVQLIPGDPFSALARAANALPDTDLLIISADQDQEALQRAWFYVPRMLHSRSQVFQQQTVDGSAEGEFHTVDAQQIQNLALGGRRQANQVREAKRAA